MKSRRTVLTGLAICVLACGLLLFGCEDALQLFTTYQSVFFDGNGQTAGEPPLFCLTAVVHETVTIPSNTGNLAKEGYNFAGWNTKADGLGYTFLPGDTLPMPAASFTLYAMWSLPYALGDTGPAGGLIFFVDESNSRGWRFLEAAPASPLWNDKFWGCQDMAQVEGTFSEVGTGQANTDLILTAATGCAQRANFAASLCDTLAYGGYDDWFLPSMDELLAMYDNLHKNQLGGFTQDTYWSSTADTTFLDSAKIVAFTNGETSNHISFVKQNAVLAVRTLH